MICLIYVINGMYSNEVAVFFESITDSTLRQGSHFSGKPGKLGNFKITLKVRQFFRIGQQKV